MATVTKLTNATVGVVNTSGVVVRVKTHGHTYTGGGSTDLSYTASTRVIASSTGDDATLPESDGVNAGLMSSAQHSKLAAIEAGATVDQTDLEIQTAVAKLIDAKGDLLVGTADDARSRLAVGANGLVLTADSAEVTGLKWAAASAGVIPDKLDLSASFGGQGGGIPGVTRTDDSSSTIVADQRYDAYWYCPYDLTLTNVGIDVIAGAGTVLRVYVTEMDPSDCQPHATGLVGQTTLDPSTAGSKSDSISWSCTGGKYYQTHIVCDGAPNLENVLAQINAPSITADYSATALVLFLYRQTLASAGTAAVSDPVPAASAQGWLGDIKGVQHWCRFDWTID
jgi:hypothetical protein